MGKLKNHGLASMLGLLIGMVLLWWVEPTTEAGRALLIALPVALLNALTPLAAGFIQRAPGKTTLLLLCLSVPLTGCSDMRMDTVARPAASAPPAQPLMATRNFALRSDIPPQGVGAYGIVAFPRLPVTDQEKQRAQRICLAFVNAFPTVTETLPSRPLSQQMITVWPVTEIDSAMATKDCGAIVARYDLYSGQAAILDADRQNQKLTGDGPFLIAWSPAQRRGQRDAIVLTFDLSSMNSQESFLDAFTAWKNRIGNDPSLWQGGFSMEGIRLAIRDFADRYGPTILKFLEG